MTRRAIYARPYTEDFVAETKLPTEQGYYRVRGYRHTVDGQPPSEPVAVVYGDIEGKEAVPVRVHDACFTSEVLGEARSHSHVRLRYLPPHTFASSAST